MDDTKTKPEPALADDLLRGVPAISRYTGETPRQTYYALTEGLLPGFKRGKIWYSRKSSLNRRFDELETGASKLR
jgi:hypothetical protein